MTLQRFYDFYAIFSGCIWLLIGKMIEQPWIIWMGAIYLWLYLIILFNKERQNAEN